MSEPFYKITDTNAVALSFPEEIRLLRDWLDHQNHASREVLVKNYILFSVKTSKRKFPSLPEDDAVIVAHRGLLEAIDHFKPDREKLGRLANLIPWYLRIEFKKFLRESELVKFPKDVPREGRYVHLSAPPDHSGGVSKAGSKSSFQEHSLLDKALGTESSAAENLDLEDRNRAIRAAAESLPEQMRGIIDLVYFQGHNYASAARLLNVSRERIRQIHNDAVEVLRRNLEKTSIFNP